MTILQTLLNHVAEITLAMSVVIAALLLLRPLLGKRYRSRLYWWAWLLIAVRLVIPWNPSLPDAPVRVEVPDQTLVYQAARPSEQTVSPPEATVTVPPDLSGGATTAPIQPPAEIPEPINYVPALTLAQLLSLLWAAGGAVFLCVNLISYARFRQKTRRWRRAEDDPAVLARFEELKQELGVKKLKLARCSAISSPLVTGFVRPVLLLPGEAYSQSELDAILRHELTHVKRGDLWYKLLILLARSVHWFNPLVHLMARRAERDLEISCDEAVVAGRDADFQYRYGSAVLAAAERGLRQTAPLTSCFHGSKSAMKERLKAIVGKSGRKRGVALLCVIVVLVATVAAACSVTGSDDDQPDQTRWELDGYAIELLNNGADQAPTFNLVQELDGETVQTPFRQVTEEEPRNPEVRAFTDVLGHSGFVLSYGLDPTSQPVEYYTLTEESGRLTPNLLLACDGKVYELDTDRDGTAEVLEISYDADGDARLYRAVNPEEQGSLAEKVMVGDVNHAAAVALGFIRGGVGVEYVEPEGGYIPGQPLQFRCFTRSMDANTVAGNAVARDTLVSVEWDDLTYQWPIETFENTTDLLWPNDPDGMSRDSGTLTCGIDGGYQVDFTLHIPANVWVQGRGGSYREYWSSGQKGELVMVESLPEGLTYEGDGVYVDLRRDSNVTWYYALSDSVHYVRFQWDASDLETAEKMRDTLVLSNDGPVVRTYYEYEKPTSEMFGLTGEYAAIFDCLVDEYWMRHQDAYTLYLPRFTCYGTYEAAGRVVYVCHVQENYYYELTLENRSVMPGAGSTLMAFYIGGSGAGTPVIDYWGRAQDGEGYGASVRDLCGPLTDLADAYLGVEGAEDVSPIWNELPSGPDMLRQYVALTGAPIDTVAIYGTEMVPLADYREGW